MMQSDQAAKIFKELGHPTRLAIYKQVVKAGFKGTPVGNIQQQLGVPGSTLSHHISALVSAGLVDQHREGRTLFCIAQYEQLEAVIGFLQDECCIDEE